MDVERALRSSRIRDVAEQTCAEHGLVKPHDAVSYYQMHICVNQNDSRGTFKCVEKEENTS